MRPGWQNNRGQTPSIPARSPGPTPRRVRHAKRNLAPKQPAGPHTTIESLPVELLQQIFLLATRPEYPNVPLNTMQAYRLAQVCRIWRAAALAYAPLWSRLAFRSLGSVCNRVLMTHLDFERASICSTLDVSLYCVPEPLYIFSDAAIDRKPIADTRQEQRVYLSHALSPSVQTRIGVLRIGPIPSSVLEPMAEKLDFDAMQGLSEVYFQQGTYEGNNHRAQCSSIVELLCAAAQDLRVLSLWGVILSPGSLSSSLRVLKIEFCVLPEPPVWADALSGLTHLEELHLLACMLPRDPGAAGVPDHFSIFAPALQGPALVSNPILLPALQRLHVRPFIELWDSFILSHFRCPTLQALHILSPSQDPGTRSVLPPPSYEGLFVPMLGQGWQLEELALDFQGGAKLYAPGFIRSQQHARRVALSEELFTRLMWDPLRGTAHDSPFPSLEELALCMDSTRMDALLVHKSTGVSPVVQGDHLPSLLSRVFSPPFQGRSSVQYHVSKPRQELNLYLYGSGRDGAAELHKESELLQSVEQRIKLLEGVGTSVVAGSITMYVGRPVWLLR
ncbi:hypothetical protein CALCODRAFT_148400 [Calocera cornea HHB12733]|uniref:F-box domain-containing protein n=1 Tax=Calocera cornea HHB12733 TaxID=1353952 RepID=A0A165CQA1_9BASI|nr:hypothetical protein CALCODRAFT_148400 [Calocera cornea HHB12733]